jgi:hypothetical protein
MLPTAYFLPLQDGKVNDRLAMLCASPRPIEKQIDCGYRLWPACSVAFHMKYMSPALISASRSM